MNSTKHFPACMILIFFLVGCYTPDLAAERNSRLPLSMPPANLNTLTPETPNTPLSTPTARVFPRGSCTRDVNNGHIFFLKGNGAGMRNRASKYDLYIMDGNGCYPRFVMEKASGSPALSSDGSLLAIGCEDNTNLCILSIKDTLTSCSGSKDEVGNCLPKIQQKYGLPSAIAGSRRMYNITWSPTGNQIAVEGGNEETSQNFVYTLQLTKQGEWEIYLQGLGPYNIAWSPRENQLVYSGLSFINLQNTNIGISGINPEWSSDGKKIAFLKASNDKNKESYGIAMIDLTDGNWRWLYEPVLRDDEYYYPPHNIVIRDDYGHRLLSWSPDERYIAFVTRADVESKSHILRLDVITGEIVNLTANIGREMDSQDFYAPEWGH